MKVLFLAGLALLAAVSAGVFFCGIRTGPTPVPKEVIAQYTAWKLKYGKLYATPAETDYRLRVFFDKVTMVRQANLEYEETIKSNGMPPLSGPMFSLKKFSDLTTEEFKSRYTGLDITRRQPEAIEELEGEEAKSIPLIRREGLGQTDAFQIKVRNQGECGASYAFAAIQTLERHYYDIKKVQIDLSVQELVDCSPLDNGCGGGWLMNTFNYVKTNGLSVASAYPYIASKNRCRPDPVKRVYFGSTLSPKEVNFSILNAKAISSRGINAGVMVFSAGKFSHLSMIDDVYDASTSGECVYKADHAVTITSVGTDTVTILNSWGTDWGVGGYKRVKPCSTDLLIGTPSMITHSYGSF